MVVYDCPDHDPNRVEVVVAAQDDAGTAQDDADIDVKGDNGFKYKRHKNNNTRANIPRHCARLYCISHAGLFPNHTTCLVVGINRLCYMTLVYV